MAEAADQPDGSVDVLVIGAEFSGLYLLHRLRQLGIRTRALQMAENIGGTWLFNRCPGARCDIESIEYSYNYNFSDEIQQDWVWTESMPAQPEIEAYLNFMADRLDPRRDIRFLLVQRRQRTGQEADGYGLYRRHPRVSAPLRGDRGRRIRRLQPEFAV